MATQTSEKYKNQLMLTTPIYTDPFHPHLIMHRVEGGSFMMGGSDKEAEDYEKPVHKVTVPTFYMGKFLVTQSLWTEVMGNNPSNLIGEDRPVNNVSWLDIVNNFLPKLNHITGEGFRLPSEAEWEFAGRGGIKSEGFLYCGSDKLKQVGWFMENSNDQIHSVGLKKGNELGLFDMSGNVLEWCADHWHDDYKSAPIDGSVWLSENEDVYRVLRGSSFFNAAQHSRATQRFSNRPDFRSDFFGFRLALSPS